jgi:low affinity Fe/Cu permease
MELWNRLRRCLSHPGRSGIHVMTSKSRHMQHAVSNDTLAARFSTLAQKTALWTGHPFAFLLAVTVVAVWVLTGPVFDYSDTWQLVINTGTTIVTFLMVFMIQNTQNRDTLAIQLKLTELVLAMKEADNEFASIEDLTDEELQELHEECRARVEMTATHIDRRRVPQAGSMRAAAHRSKTHTRRSSGRRKASAS